MDYPIEPQQVERGIIRWDLPLIQRKPGSQYYVVVACECGSERTVAVHDTRRARRPFTGLCTKCWARQHYSTLNNKVGPACRTYKGGRVVDPDGYVHIMLYPGDFLYETRPVRKHRPGTVVAGGGRYILEHRHVMARAIGRALYPWEQVHHKDRNKANNHPDNLEIIDGDTHSAITRLHAENIRLSNENDHLREALARLQCDPGPST